MRRPSPLFYLSLLLQFDIILIHTQTPTEPCAAVSSVLAVQATDTAVNIPAEVAYQYLESVPVVQKDATDLLDAWAVFLLWQSDLTYKAKPPSGYLYPGMDYFQAIADLRQRVTSGNITRELDLQNGILDIWYGVNDGHMTLATDFNNAFTWNRQSSIVAVTPDAHSVPEVFILPEVQLSLLGKLTYTPSPIVAVDGEPITDFLTSDYNKVDRLQDPDTMYNYPGLSTTLTFAKCAKQSYPKNAVSSLNFTRITEGPSFYNQVCNATQKMLATSQDELGSRKGKLSKPDSKTHQLSERQPSELEPVIQLTTRVSKLISSAAARGTTELLSSRFLNSPLTTYRKHRSFSRNSCKDGIDHLVLDLSSNGGGDIMVAYDIMKQLFPTIEPYFQRDYRAQPQIEMLGEYFTNLTSAILVATHGNRTATLGPPDGGNAYDDTFRQSLRRTSLFTWDISDTVYVSNFVDEKEPYVVTGFDFNAPGPPQTFTPENIVILSNGRSSSSCTTLSHFLKWQSKVKSIAMVARPQLGPMQQQGGIKGANKASHSPIVFAANELIHGDTIEQADYLKYRTLDSTSSDAISINLVNSVLVNEAANGNSTLYADKETTPLQYIYEAADCRMFFTAGSANFRHQQWYYAADQAFGFNGTEVFSGCVEGSTNHPSSLSGDAKLLNGGKVVNVTGFQPPNTGAGPVDTSTFNLTGNRLIKAVDEYLANLTASACASGNGPQASRTAIATPTSGRNAGGWTRVEAVKGGMKGSLVAVGMALLAAV